MPGCRWQLRCRDARQLVEFQSFPCRDLPAVGEKKHTSKELEFRNASFRPSATQIHPFPQGDSRAWGSKQKKKVNFSSALGSKNVANLYISHLFCYVKNSLEPRGGSKKKHLGKKDVNFIRTPVPMFEKKSQKWFGVFFISLNPNQQIAVKNLRMFFVSNTSLWFRKQKVLPSILCFRCFLSGKRFIIWGPLGIDVQ